MSDQLTSEFWVSAHVRQCHLLNMPAFIVRRGDRERGSILVKVNRFRDGCALYQPQSDMDGARFWMSLTGDSLVDESKVDEMIKKRLGYDDDLWVVEIEDQHGTHEFDAPIRHF